jgi:D-alanine-D-alanine ligase-like ATP-grasp enzyme
MRELDLQFGTSDWIIDESGVHHLLEVNPHGAWLWLDELVPSAGITKMVASQLIR